MNLPSRQQDVLRRILKRARRAPGGGPALEAVGAARQPPVDGGFARASLDAAERAMESDPAIDPAARRDALDAGRAAYRRIVEEGRAPDAADAVALEAIQLFDGSRPAILLRDDALPLDDPELGDWQGTAAIHAGEIAALAAAVCLVEKDGSPLGSGFAAGGGLVLTNRHVLEAALAETEAGWSAPDGLTVAFAPGARQDVTGVAWAGPRRIGPRLDFGRLDMALIRVAGPTPAPPRLDGIGALDSPERLVMDGAVGAIGFPLRIDGGGHEARTRRLFEGRIGRKCWAPGRIDALPGTLPDDMRKEWMLRHDASTLPGNSGSVVGDLRADASLALGLHVGGATLAGNFAHSLAAARNHLAAAGLVLDPPGAAP